MIEFNQSASSKLVKDVVALGKKYSKTGFPNPNREGCPTRSSLKAMANRDRSLTLGDLPVSHIVSCSPCFQEYERLRRMSLLFRGAWITAASLVILAAGFMTARVAYKRTGTGTPTISKKQTTDRPDVAANHTIPSVAPFSLNIDLASFSPTRGDAKDDSSKKIHLPSKSLRVNFLLPLGMESGEYSLRLQDSTGTVFADKRAPSHMKDGVTSVQVDIDLAGTHGGNFTLMMRPPGLSWRSFPVVVE
jgi:hypothetical protein